MTQEINTIGIYDVNEDVSGKFSTVYLRDLDDKHLMPPVQVKPSFGRKLKSHLDKVVDDNFSINDAGHACNNVGVVSGVVIDDEVSGLSKVDWSTVNLNKMTQTKVDLEEASVDFNAKGVYGSIASGHVRKIDAGDNVIVVSDGREAFRPLEIHGDSSQFADTNLKLLVNPVGGESLDYKDELQIQHEFAKYGDSLLNSSETNHVKELEALQDIYNHDIYSSDGIDEIEHQPNLLGSIKDIVSDVKAYAKANDKTVDEALSQGGGVLQTIQARSYNEDTQSSNMVEKSVTSDEFADFASKRQAERGINPVVFSNLTVEEVDEETSHLKIRNWDNVKINETSARKYAKAMRDVVTLNSDEVKRPYSIKTAVNRSKELDVEEKKTRTEDYSFEL